MIENIKIDDPLIRALLKRRLISQGLLQAQIIEEIAIDRGKAIADVIGLYKVPHCYEIKSEVDTLKRLEFQSKIFEQFFPKVSLITVEKHLSKAKDIIPKWWGIQTVANSHSGLKLITYRPTSYNPEFLKSEHLKLLWNEQLKHELSSRNVKYKANYNREELAMTLSNQLNKQELFSVTQKYLRNRLIDKAQMLSM